MLDKIQNIAEQAMIEYNLPGLSIAFEVPEKRPHFITLGVKRREGKPIQLDDCFHIGSCSKPLTADIIVEYARLERLNLAEPIQNFFSSEIASSRTKGLTLRNFLDHTSGVSEKSNSELQKKAWALEGDIQQQRRNLSHLIFSFIGGDHSFSYSNFNYVVAGSALESRIGAQWETLIKSYFTDKYNMRTLGVGPPAASNPLHPWGHKLSPTGAWCEIDPTSQIADNPIVLGPAGRLHCSTSDLLAFCRRFWSFYEESEKATLIMPTGAGSAHYSLGWFVSHARWADGPIFSHDGSNTTFYTTMMSAPRIRTAFVAQTNIGGRKAASALRFLRSMITSLIVGKP